MATALKSIFAKAPPYVSRATNMLSWGLGAGNMESQLGSMTAVGTLFAIVDMLAEAVAAVPWSLWKDDEEQPNHPAARLWAKPNLHMDRVEFLEGAQHHFDLAGEQDWYIGYSTMGGSRPLELWPIRPDRLQPVPDPNDYLAGWIYRNGGVSIPWSVKEVIQVKRPSPLDPYRGISAVAAAMTDVYGEQAASRYNAMFFQNSAEPGGVIQFDHRLDQAEWDEFVERWKETHQGVDNAHRIAILENATWQERRYTFRDMQFDSMRKLNREFIREAFHFPKPMLGGTEDVNKAAAVAGEYVFARWLVKPRLERIKSALNNKFLPLFGTSATGLDFRYGENGSNEIVGKDTEIQITERDSDASRVKTLIDAGLDPEAVLAYVGLPPMAFVGAAPAQAASEPTNRGGRSPLALDADARSVWTLAEGLRRDNPGMTQTQIAAELGISDRQLRRYRDAFTP